MTRLLHRKKKKTSRLHIAAGARVIFQCVGNFLCNECVCMFLFTGWLVLVAMRVRVRVRVRVHVTYDNRIRSR